MTRPASILIVILALAFSSCGDDDTGSETPAPTSAPTTAAPSGTTAAPATEAPPAPTTAAPAATTTTTAAPATTTTAPPATGSAAFIAAAIAYVGSYEGEWNNTTFGSSGSIEVTIVEANTEAGFVLVQIDLGGNVFGAADPDPFTLEIFTNGPDDLESGFTSFLSASSFEIDENGMFTLTADAQGLGLPIVIQGGVVDGGFAGTYTIEGLAEGTWSAAPKA